MNACCWCVLEPTHDRDSCLNEGSRTCFVPRAYQSLFVVGNTKLNISSMVWIILNSQIMTQYTNIKKNNWITKCVWRGRTGAYWASRWGHRVTVSLRPWAAHGLPLGLCLSPSWAGCGFDIEVNRWVLYLQIYLCFVIAPSVYLVLGTKTRVRSLLHIRPLECVNSEDSIRHLLMCFQGTRARKSLFLLKRPASCNVMHSSPAP